MFVRQTPHQSQLFHCGLPAALLTPQAPYQLLSPAWPVLLPAQLGLHPAGFELEQGLPSWVPRSEPLYGKEKRETMLIQPANMSDHTAKNASVTGAGKQDNQAEAAAGQGLTLATASGLDALNDGILDVVLVEGDQAVQELGGVSQQALGGVPVAGHLLAHLGGTSPVSKLQSCYSISGDSKLTSMTILTPAGGFERDLTSTTSFLDRFFRLAVAASSAGKASSSLLLVSGDAHHHGFHINRGLLQHWLELPQLSLQHTQAVGRTIFAAGRTIFAARSATFAARRTTFAVRWTALQPAGEHLQPAEPHLHLKGPHLEAARRATFTAKRLQATLLGNGHSRNQSMVQQFTSAGNMRKRCLQHTLSAISNLKKL
ncbi:MAG: hypothetical protein FRX49_01182 [Trebouxia sp. A1-2]|nr:MAG: hypothetical protein FRX49_01182 [Trebouxia sp. A1-2]